MTKARPETRSRSPRMQKRNSQLCIFYYSPKLSIFILITCVTLFILLHIKILSLQTSQSSLSSPSSSLPWKLMIQWQNTIVNPTSENLNNSINHKLRLSVTFLPLKDLRYSHIPLQGHTWFMSSLDDTHQNGDVQFQKFPSQSSQNRLLCLKGRDTHDGSWNSYALAWPEALPYNATFMKGLTFVSYNHYNYENLWHGLSAMVPFVAWHLKSNCTAIPTTWVLYHWGEHRLELGPWVKSLMEATFDGPVNIERFGGDEPVCFEEAVVMRHNEGGMSRERRMEVYDLMRCKARIYCGLGSKGWGEGGEVGDEKGGFIGMTLFLRTGPRSFNNETVVAEVFRNECAKVVGCRFMVAHSNNLTFCEQVKLMSMTDILISPHGAQLTNLFLMDRNSSVMEFFPKGWLKLAGVGQYVYHWIASWSSMKHQGAWRDPNGDHCPYSEDDRRCMSIYKSGTIGHNQTHFAEWATNVLAQVKLRKTEKASFNSTPPVCSCASSI